MIRKTFPFLASSCCWPVGQSLFVLCDGLSSPWTLAGKYHYQYHHHDPLTIAGNLLGASLMRPTMEEKCRFSTHTPFFSQHFLLLLQGASSPSLSSQPLPWLPPCTSWTRPNLVTSLLRDYFEVNFFKALYLVSQRNFYSQGPICFSP